VLELYADRPDHRGRLAPVSGWPRKTVTNHAAAVGSPRSGSGEQPRRRPCQRDRSRARGACGASCKPARRTQSHGQPSSGTSEGTTRLRAQRRRETRSTVRRRCHTSPARARDQGHAATQHEADGRGFASSSRADRSRRAGKSSRPAVSRVHERVRSRGRGARADLRTKQRRHGDARWPPTVEPDQSLPAATHDRSRWGDHAPGQPRNCEGGRGDVAGRGEGWRAEGATYGSGPGLSREDR
jgi:hypothetical protein